MSFQTFKQRDDWMRAVLADAALSHQARNALVRIALYLNIDAGRCDPGYDELANALGCSSRTANRWVREGIVPGGWHLQVPVPLATISGSFGQVELVTTVVMVDDTPTVTTAVMVDKANHDKFATSTMTNSATNHDNCCHTEQRITAKRTAKGELSLPLHLRRERKNPEENQTQAFESFWAIYPKRAAKLDAKKAFMAALKVAPADVILAGARRYAADRAGQEVRYTKHPATWLRAGCWSDDGGDAGKPILDQNGDIIGHVPPNRAPSQGPPKTAMEIVRRRALARANEEGDDYAH